MGICFISLSTLRIYHVTQIKVTTKLIDFFNLLNCGFFHANPERLRNELSCCKHCIVSHGFSEHNYRRMTQRSLRTICSAVVMKPSDKEKLRRKFNK